jgi:hypothetical protein
LLFYARSFPFFFYLKFRFNFEHIFNRKKTKNFSDDGEIRDDKTTIQQHENHENLEGDLEMKSTGCGPSPDREIEEFLSQKIPSENSNKISKPSSPTPEPNKSSKVSIGTSPPPQTCGTQVRRFFFLIFLIFNVHLSIEE